MFLNFKGAAGQGLPKLSGMGRRIRLVTGSGLGFRV